MQGCRGKSFFLHKCLIIKRLQAPATSTEKALQVISTLLTPGLALGSVR
jgi:hypothetical protein